MYGNQLSPQEIRGIRSKKAFTLVGALAAFVVAVGWPAEAVNEGELKSNAVALAETAYKGQSLLGKYETAFIKPLVAGKISTRTGGRGLMGLADRTQYVDVLVDQNCLKSTAYDTTPHAEGRQPASWRVNNNTLTITPAGSGTLNSLTFKVGTDHTLDMDNTTAATIQQAAQPCEIQAIPVGYQPMSSAAPVPDHSNGPNYFPSLGELPLK